MRAVWCAMLAGAGTALAGCASEATLVERDRLPVGNYDCSNGVLAGSLLMIHPDGVYEVRRTGPGGAVETGWLEPAEGGVKPTSGPLAGAVGRSADGGLQFSGPAAGLAGSSCKLVAS